MATVIGVRFKNVGKMYYFDPGDARPKKGDHAIVETARGVECGEVTMECREVSDDNIVQPLKKVIRIATKEDLARVEDNHRREKSATRPSVRLISSAISPADRQMTCSTFLPLLSVESMRFPDVRRTSAIWKLRLRTASMRAVVSLPERGTLAPLDRSRPAMSASSGRGPRRAITHSGVSPSSFFTLASAPLSSKIPTAVISAK